MKVIFCGTPDFAVPTLQALVAAGHHVALVLSQPDRPIGRAGQVNPTPVKQAAQELGISVAQPEKLKINEMLRLQLSACAPDVIVVVAYGRILPQWMLDLPQFGCINGHASLLPRWRGAAPIQWAIASGDEETGVTTMRLNAGLDTGPMLMKWAVEITPHTTAPLLFESLAEIGAQLMVATLAGLEAGSIVPQVQDDSKATLAPILTREDARIDFRRSAREIDQRFRGFQPWPGAYTTLRGKKLIVHEMHLSGAVADAVPGAIGHGSGRFVARCGDGNGVVLDTVQLEGKKRMAAEEFLRGFQVKPGEVLGEGTA